MTLARALGVRGGEEGRAVRLLGLVFTVSAALVLMKAAQSGIFLSVYPRAMISWAFAASAVALASASMIVVSLAGRLRPVELASGVLGVSGAVLLVLFALLAAGASHVAFALYVLVEAIAGILLIQIWSVVSEAIDTRSAKRILPIAGIGASLAWTFGGFLTTPLVHLVGASGLLVVAPALLFVGLAIVRAVARIDLASPVEKPLARRDLVGEWRRGLAFVRDVPLMRLGVALSVLALLTEQLMDFQMMAAARDRFPQQGSCASFFGAYYGATSAVSLALLVGASGRVLASFGAARALLVTPAVTIGAAAVAATMPGFLPIVALRASDRVLKQSLWSSAMEQTQTPLPVQRRAQSRALVRGVLAPLAYGIAALVLASLPEHFDLRWLALATLGGCAIMGAIVARGVRRAYRRALRDAIDGRRLDLDASPREALDADACRALEDELRSEDEGRSSLAAELLRSSGNVQASTALAAGLGHRSHHVRAVAIEGLAAMRAKIAASAIAARLDDDDAVDVRLAAARALGVLGGGSREVEEALARAAERSDAEVAAAARASLARLSSTKASRLLALLRDPDPIVVAEALLALDPSTSTGDDATSAIRACLAADSTFEVRREALRAVARLRRADLVADVVALLDDPRLSSEAAAALSSWDVALDALAIDAKDPETVRRAAPALSSQPSGQTLLVRLLSHADAAVREQASRALGFVVGRGRRAPVERAVVLPLLDREIASAYRLTSILAGLAHDDGTPDWEIEPPFAFLAGEVERRFFAVRRRILRLVALLGNHRAVRAIEFGLRKPTPALDAKVAELLDVALEPPLGQKIVPLFDRLTLRERSAIAKKLGHFVDDAKADPLAAILALEDPHIRGSALAAYGDRFRMRYEALYQEEAKLIPLFEKMSFLRSVPLFGDLSGEDLRSVAEMIDDVDVAAGDTVFAKGDPGDDMYVVLSGKMAVRDGKIELATLGPREFFGELAVLDREPRSADVVCVEDARLLRLRSADLAELMARRPQIQEQILMVLVRRIRALTQRFTA